MITYLNEAAGVVPSANQLKWFDLEGSAFAHYGPNSFTGNDWGMGNEP